MIGFPNQVLWEARQMASSSRIELKFAARPFFSCFSDCNSGGGLLTSRCTRVERVLYDSSIACLREGC